MYLHHYVTKSKEEFLVKVRRGDPNGNRKQEHFCDEMNSQAAQDFEVLRMPRYP